MLQLPLAALILIALGPGAFAQVVVTSAEAMRPPSVTFFASSAFRGVGERFRRGGSWKASVIWDAEAPAVR